MIAPAADDQILDPPGQVHVAAGQIAPVAGIQPGVAVGKQPAGGFRIAVVAGGRGRPLEFQAAFPALRQFPAVVVNNADLMAGQRLPAGGKTQGVGDGGVRRLGLAAGHERLAPHPVDERRSSRRLQGQSDRAFRQTVDWSHGFRAEAVAAEAGDEALQRVRVDRFGAVAGHAPGTEVQFFDLVILNGARAQFVGEIGRRRQGAAMAMNGPKPAGRPSQETQRRHHHQGKSVVQTAQAGADQAHVVIQWQPTDEDVVGPDPEMGTHGPEISQEIGVSQHDPLGIAGAAGGVLQEG